MPPRRGDVDIVNMLQPAVTTSSLVIGQSIFNGPVKPPGDFVDDLAVFIVPFSGPPPEAFGGAGTTSIYKSNWQLWIRGGQRDYDTAFVLAKEIARLLQSDREISIPGYMDVQLNESEPIYNGVDDDGLHEFSLNVELIYDE